jgi:hypothetical protein
MERAWNKEGTSRAISVLFCFFSNFLMYGTHHIGSCKRTS